MFLPDFNRFAIQILDLESVNALGTIRDIFLFENIMKSDQTKNMCLDWSVLKLSIVANKRIGQDCDRFLGSEDWVPQCIPDEALSLAPRAQGLTSLRTRSYYQKLQFVRYVLDSYLFWIISDTRNPILVSA